MIPIADGKTHILTTKDGPSNKWKKGELGYIDGWVVDSSDIIRACVVIDDAVVFLNRTEFKVVYI